MTTIEPDYGAQPYDDAETDVLPLRRKRRLSLATGLLALAVVAGAAFLGGVEIQKHYGKSGSSAGGAGAGPSAALTGAGQRSGAGAASRGSAGSGTNGFTPPSGAFGSNGSSNTPFTAGLVTLIKGSTLYVTDVNGNTVKVRTKLGLQVTKTVTSSVKRVHPGDSVVVRGTKRKDGSYTASSLSINNGGGSGGGGFGSSGSGGFGGAGGPSFGSNG